MTSNNHLKLLEDRALREEKAEADAMFLSIGEGAFVTDSRGMISRINKAALEILGFEEVELMGKWYPGIVIAEDENGNVIHNYDRPITQVFLTGKTISTRLYYRRKDGGRVAVALNVAPVLLRSKPIGAIEVFRDITRELALEHAKDEFISIASHQLRTPATGVKQYVGMLLEGYAGKLTPKQIKLLKNAYQSNERQLKIIEDLLKVARVDAGNIELKKEKIDIVKLLKDVLRDLKPKASRYQQNLSLQTRPAKISVLVDSAKIRMVLENIIDNAIKYTPDGKNITIKAFRQHGNAVIQVIDEGVGIPKEDLHRLFQKFSRIANPLSVEAGGTGLGLYWAEKIVRLHGGCIKIKSTPNKGSIFSVLIPLAANILTDPPNTIGYNNEDLKGD